MKNIDYVTIIFLVLFITGCAGTSSITFYSNPPGAMIYVGDRNGTEIENEGLAPLIQYYSMPNDLKCTTTGKVVAKWDNGQKEFGGPFNICINQKYQHTFNRSELGEYIPKKSSPLSNSLDQAKNQCKDLGYKPGTEKFGNCVLELNK